MNLFIVLYFLCVCVCVCVGGGGMCLKLLGSFCAEYCLCGILGM